MAYIAYRKAFRRIEWYFLRRVIYRRLRAAAVLGECIELAFKRKYPAVERLTTSLYYRPGYGLGESCDGRKTIYWEAPLAFTIWTEEGPAFGMAVEFRRDALCIRQLQGVAGTQLPKEMRGWPKLFVQACIRFARLGGIKHVRLYRANNSIFYYFPEIKVKEDEDAAQVFRAHKQRMDARYSGTARKLKMKKKPRWGEWTHPNCA